jgi:hypothetical protein
MEAETTRADPEAKTPETKTARYPRAQKVQQKLSGLFHSNSRSSLKGPGAGCLITTMTSAGLFGLTVDITGHISSLRVISDVCGKARVES